MLYRVFTSLPGSYTASFHYQGVIPCVFLTTRMLHCMISSLSGCYTVCFPHYQDATLYHFVITRILYHIISYLCILHSWNRTHNRQGIHNRMFRVGLCIRHPLCQLLYHLHDICERQDPNTRHLQENRGPYLFIAGQITQVFFYCCSTHTYHTGSELGASGLLRECNHTCKLIKHRHIKHSVIYNTIKTRVMHQR